MIRAVIDRHRYTEPLVFTGRPMTGVAVHFDGDTRMLDESDEFDLDIRLFAVPGNERLPLWAPGFANADPQDGGLQAAPDTLGADCITTDADCNTSDTSCGFTCGCNTN